MNKLLHLASATLVALGLFSVKAFAQSESAVAEAPSAAQPAETKPATGYQSMLPYINENAEIRKEAARKYGSHSKKKKSKKSKSKSKKKSKKSAPSV